MAAVTGLTLVKRFTYRGDATEEFSNTYHFKDAPPGDDPSWLVLTNDVVGVERMIYGPGVSYARAYGYNSDDPTAHHVFSHDWVISGGAPVGGYGPDFQVPMAGDQASCVEWRLDRLSSKGKPVYLRKYHHAGYIDPSSADSLKALYFDHLTTYAGTGGIQAIHGGLRSQLKDDNVTATRVIGWVTTRTLKRRGKRPRTGS